MSQMAGMMGKEVGVQNTEKMGFLHRIGKASVTLLKVFSSQNGSMILSTAQTPAFSCVHRYLMPNTDKSETA